MRQTVLKLERMRPETFSRQFRAEEIDTPFALGNGRRPVADLDRSGVRRPVRIDLVELSFKRGGREAVQAEPVRSARGIVSQKFLLPSNTS